MTIGLISAVATDLGVSVQVAARIAASASKRYKVFSIPKRRGNGYRLVAQPAREVKAVQRAIVRFLLGKLPVHPRATAYEPNTSINVNAWHHAGCSYLLKLDFESFFPSISSGSLSQHLAKFLPEISQSELDFISGACLWRGPTAHYFGLCIGAPSSPFLSNTIMFEFDSELFEFCEFFGVNYSRYSDDLTFSSGQKEVLRRIEQFARGLLVRVSYPQLTLNEAKRVSVSRGGSMRVTGLTLTNQGGVTVGRVRKRGVRAGVASYMAGRLMEEKVPSLKGELAFVLGVEPDFVEVLRARYGPALDVLLPKANRLV